MGWKWGEGSKIEWNEVENAKTAQYSTDGNQVSDEVLSCSNFALVVGSMIFYLYTGLSLSWRSVALGLVRVLQSASWFLYLFIRISESF